MDVRMLTAIRNLGRALAQQKLELPEVRIVVTDEMANNARFWEQALQCKDILITSETMPKPELPHPDPFERIKSVCGLATEDVVDLSVALRKLEKEGINLQPRRGSKGDRIRKRQQWRTK